MHPRFPRVLLYLENVHSFYMETVYQTLYLNKKNGLRSEILVDDIVRLQG